MALPTLTFCAACSAPPSPHTAIESEQVQSLGIAGPMMLRISAARWEDGERQDRRPFDIRTVESVEVSVDGDPWGSFAVSAGAGDDRVALLRIEPGRELESTHAPPGTLGGWAALLANGATQGAHILRLDAAQIRDLQGRTHRVGVAEAYLDFMVAQPGVRMDLGELEFVVTEEVEA